MRINKLLTNGYELTEEEKANLKVTLQDVIGEIQSEEGYWRPFVNGTNGNLYWEWDTSPSGNTPAQRKILYWPAFSADPENSHLLWKLDDDESWTDLNITTSGARGPQGDPGQKGADGTSIRLVSTETVIGGTQVTLGWGTSDTSAFVIPSGAAGTPGTNGTDGVSPTVTTSALPDSTQHPQGGTSVTITDKTGEHQFNVWNGINGEGTTVNLLDGTGIHITEDGTNYTIGVSADYALKTDISDMATKTWVGQQGYLTSIPNTYALKTDVEAASANALSEAESWVEGKHYLTAVPDDYATKTYANNASANALGQAKTWVGQQNFATSAGLDANKQFAMTTSGWKEVQGGGTTYTPGDCIDITNDVISFDGLNVDTTYSGTLPKLTGDGTTEHPLSMSAFSNSVEATMNSFSTALTNLANEISSLGSSITLKGEGTCNDITNYLNQAQVGDAYIATDNGSIWSKTVNKGDMVVKTSNSISVLTTSPDLSVYAKLSELPTVVPGANVVVTPTIVDGHTQYMITSVGGGGGAGIAYQFTSNDGRFTWSQSADDPQSPTVMTETLNVNLPKFEAVTSMPGTTTPNTYYFVYEE